MPKLFILLGDFNCHNAQWGCKDTNKKGKILEMIINENDMWLLNNCALTYVKPSSGNHSAIDLTICDSTVYMDLEDSDHFPILIKSTEPRKENTPLKVRQGQLGNI